MKKFFLFGLTIVILTVGSKVWSGVSAATPELSKTQSLHATDAAYRDGLFLGKFDAHAGRSHRVCVGRWGTQPDRASFATGYEDGYAQAAAGSADEAE